MADFSITLTIEDAKVAEFIAAANWAWNDPASPTMTAAELKAEFKRRSENALKDVYRRYKEYLRSQSAIDTEIVIG